MVKTLYINYKDAKKERDIGERQGIKEGECCVEEEYYEKEAQGGEANISGGGGEGFNAFIHAGVVEEAPEREEMLGVWWKNIWGQFKRVLGPPS